MYMCIIMAYKNISVSVDAYDRLKRLKNERESFSEEILRLTRPAKISDVVGILSDKEALEWKKGIEEVRKSVRIREWR